MISMIALLYYHGQNKSADAKISSTFLALSIFGPLLVPLFVIAGLIFTIIWTTFITLPNFIENNVKRKIQRKNRLVKKAEEYGERFNINKIKDK